MIIATIDWLIIGFYFVISIGISIFLSKKAGKNTSSFFLSGRKLPWYIAGTSMVATTFAADTPLAVTELVAEKGIAGNWLWWNMLFGGMMTVFFFARLWRRANILTDAEFVAIRYEGRAANILRGFRAVYIGVAMNSVVMAWVNLAMVKILQVLFPEFTIFGHQTLQFIGMQFSSHLILVAILLVFVSVYSSLSGLLGVSFTDAFQFLMAMTGSIFLAVFALKHVGGIEQLQYKLADIKWVFNFMPSAEFTASGAFKMGTVAIIAYLGVQWWASWYPGAEPGGGGYVAQRMMSAKNEKHSLLATLWFQVAHFALRPWPWIIAALVALVVYPNEPDKGATYVMLIRDLMPSGLLGLLVAAFFAAYMSTIASQTVWGTSYLINDLYKPYLKPNASERYYVNMSRVATFILMIISLIVTTQFSKISDAWKFILACSGGIGLVLLLRWFWWRVNAWSEITALLAPFLIYPVLHYKFELTYEMQLIIIVAWSTLLWLLATFITKPTKTEKLVLFYQKVRPGGWGWKPIQKIAPHVKAETGYAWLTLCWILGSMMVLSALFGVGKLLLKETLHALILFTLAGLCIVSIVKIMRKIGWKSWD